jgi:hypothetical protein
VSVRGARSATCRFRVCKSHPTRIMSSASPGVTSWYSARPRLPATRGCSHDISDGSLSQPNPRRPGEPPTRSDAPGRWCRAGTQASGTPWAGEVSRSQPESWCPIARGAGGHCG